MDILFVGGVFPSEMQDEILAKSRGTVQFAANALQWNVIFGLEEANDTHVDILNAPFVGSYPRLYKDIYFRSFELRHSSYSKDESIGFLNIFVIKHIWKAISLAKKVVRWANLKKQKKKAIIIYSMHSPLIFACAIGKVINKSIHLCLIAPDLPEFMMLNEKVNVILRLLKKADRLFMNIFLKYIDSFVLLTKYMAEPIRVGNKPWIVVEGMVNTKDLKTTESCNLIDKQKIILYTGTLFKAYGIMQLLDAFSLITNPSYSLWICGEGEAKEDILHLAALDKRIKFFGQVSRDEALKLQREATVLINPRGGEEAYTKYSFPSKIMEYLLSGTPTIMNMLPGIPEEYVDYIFFIENETAKGMAEKIVEVCSMPKEKLLEFGIRARNFVMANKNNIIQGKRIYDLINQ
ncbi:glycosyltransferase [Dehalobacter restrictus]|uniref:Glycosyl transferase family 1 n=1 Tax=Dehalobacter restrictus (strain DSM 9455 / PER-K23) TaxID=871738 RepID=A0ABM5P6W4_DEHRP|nr:glycosyltransferase [Dehalobacter restrictus]AHF10350.1 glycosyl transferase family 1 [Dehalobacter restrictus DSM 9455]